MNGNKALPLSITLALLASCGPQRADLFANSRQQVRNLCSPSDFPLLVGPRLSCPAAEIRVTDLPGDKPCRSELDLDNDGSIDSTSERDRFGHVKDGDFKYTVRDDGQLERVVLPAAIAGSDMTLAYSYGSDGRVTEARIGEVVVTYNWVDGRLIDERSGQDRYEHIYDGEGQLLALRRRFGPEEPPYDHRVFRYDSEGRISRVENRIPGRDPDVYDYTYDDDVVTIEPVSGDFPFEPRSRQSYYFDGNRLISLERDEDLDGTIDRKTNYVYCD